MWKNIAAVLFGALVMVLTDFLLARAAPSLFLISISASVLFGAAFAGFVAENRGWLWGFLVGTINGGITLGIFYWLSPEVPLGERGYSMFDVVARPILLSFVFGVIGGAIGGWLKGKAT